MDNEVQNVEFKQYGFGKTRSLKDYEQYSGLSFSKRAITKRVKDNLPPPDPETMHLDYEKFESHLMKIFKHCIDIRYDQVPENDYDFWCVAFKDKDGNDLYRKDADIDEIITMKNDPDGYCKIWREFQTDKKPNSWLVWPHSISKGWSDPITGNL
jgi:hypothetical protein